MDKSTKETDHDLMNVESFSQLPFIRPSPLEPKPIRLYGFQFGSNDAVSSSHEDNPTTTSKESGNSRRLIKCHFCCRKFPTSQALGGHQNAHKRERQQANRARFQPANAHNSLSDSQIYGLLNYTRRNTAPTPPSSFNYSSLRNVINPPISRFHGSFSRYKPISGNSFRFWRIPPSTSYRERSMYNSPLFSGNNFKARPVVGGASAAREWYGFQPEASVQAHVSLDLHL